jgi:hypothetical protein
MARDRLSVKTCHLSERLSGLVYIQLRWSIQTSKLEYTAKNDQVVAILMKTGLNNALLPTLFTASCQQYWTILLHPIQAQQYCSILLTSVNNVGSKTLFNSVEQQARRFLPCSRAWNNGPTKLQFVWLNWLSD